MLPDLQRLLGSTGLFDDYLLSRHDNVCGHERSDMHSQLSTTVEDEGVENMSSVATTPIFDGSPFSSPAWTPVTQSQLSTLDLSLSSLDLFLPDHKDVETLRSWNGVVPDTIPARLHDLFTQQARRHSNNEAVVAHDGTMLYSELDYTTSQLALILIDKGVSVGAFVPIVAEKSIWTVVSLLAVLKAGAAFVVIDASFPVERIHAMIEQLNAPIVLTTREQSAELLKIGGEQEVLVVNSSCISNTHISTAASLPVIGCCSPAYAVFTSGSTGTPKGILIEHAQASTSLLALNKTLHMNEQTRCFNFSSYAFDAAVFDIICPLIAGGCVCIPSEWNRVNDLAGAIEMTQANLCALTPSLASSLQHEVLPSLSSMLLVGEPISTAICTHWQQKGKRVFCGYGPAEVTLGCTLVDTSVEEFNAGYLGRSYNACLWITDPDDADILLPIGEIGELLVEGPTVSRGYINNIEATKKNFLDTPHWLATVAQRSGRVYRTGDLVRYTVDGGLEFHGRKDLQVKVHGQRIEIEEVERAMREALQHRVRLAVEVTTTTLQTSAEGLVAFLEIKDDDHKHGSSLLQHGCLASSPASLLRLQELTKGLRESLSKTLPCYMIPGDFIAVDNLPLTATAKLDRKRLRALASEHKLRPAKSDIVSPSTDVELSLFSLWGQVLPSSAGEFGVMQDFFRLGGDSLSAVRLVSRAREAGLLIDYAMLRKAPTIRQLALEAMSPSDIVDHAEDSIAAFSLISATTSVPALRQAAVHQCNIDDCMIEDIFPGTPIMQLMVDVKGKPKMFETALVFPVSDDIDFARFQLIWQDMLNDHSIFRTRWFTTNSGDVYQVVLKKDHFHIRVTPSVDVALDDVRKIGSTWTQPHLTYFVPRTETTSASIVWSVHHTRYDAVTIQNICQELNDRYHGATLPARLPFQALVKSRQNECKQRSRQFWTQYHAGAKYKTFFPVPNNYQPSISAVVLRIVPLAVPSELSGPGLKSAVILSSLALLLSKMADTPDVPFSVVRNGRLSPLPGTDTILGLVFELVPMRVSLAGADSTVFSLIQSCVDHADVTWSQTVLSNQEYREYSPECKASLDGRIIVNFVPVSEEATTNGVVGFPQEVSHLGGLGEELALPLRIGGYIRKDSLDMAIMWDKVLFGNDVGLSMMDSFEKVLAQVGRATKETRLKDISF